MDKKHIDLGDSVRMGEVMEMTVLVADDISLSTLTNTLSGAAGQPVDPTTLVDVMAALGSILATKGANRYSLRVFGEGQSFVSELRGDWFPGVAKAKAATQARAVALLALFAAGKS